MMTEGDIHFHNVNYSVASSGVYHDKVTFSITPKASKLSVLLKEIGLKQKDGCRRYLSQEKF